jgi:parallel beta-helix repeat protein
MKQTIKVVLVFAFCLTMVMAASIDANAAKKTSVGAFYPANGTNWNDYIVNDGLDEFTATDVACTGDETGGYSACMHGGEMRTFEVIDMYSCTGLTATDDLDAFNWTCDESTSPVRMVSTGLKDGKNLSDLLDFAGPGWKRNSVTVYMNGIKEQSTRSTEWWTNPIVEDNDGGSLNAAGTIYVVTNDALTPATGGYIIDASSVALVGQPGVIINGPANGNGSYVISADGSSSARDFLWIEGYVDALGDNVGIDLNNVRFSVLRNLKADSADIVLLPKYATGIYLEYSSNNKLTDISISNNGRYGVYLLYSSNNTLSGFTESNNGWGINFMSSSFNTITDVTSSKSTIGVNISSNSNNNVLSRITTSNNSTGISFTSSSYNTLTEATASNNISGIHLSQSSNNTLYKITAANNGYINGYGIGITYSSDNNTLSEITVSNNVDGVYLIQSTNNTLSGVSTLNNSWYGVFLDTSPNNTLTSITASNNGYGLHLKNSSNSSLSGVTATNNQYNIYLNLSSYNYFTGPLKVRSTTCYLTGGTDPGLVHDTCANQGASDATLTTGVTVAGSFVAKVTIDDTVNTSDIDGAALFANITDWTGFENSFRGWGTDGTAFPSASNRKYCVGGTCRIFDWSAAVGDTVIKDSLAFPTGNDTLDHEWSDLTTTTFLRNAVEIQGDEMGNENTLCESGETCLYMPNMGSYQGHGNLVSAGPFTDGTITGVTMLMYETNGR